MYFGDQAVLMNAIDHRQCIPEQVLQLLSTSKQTLLFHVALPVVARLISLPDKSSLNKETSLCLMRPEERERFRCLNWRVTGGVESATVCFRY